MEQVMRRGSGTMQERLKRVREMVERMARKAFLLGYHRHMQKDPPYSQRKDRYERYSKLVDYWATRWLLPKGDDVLQGQADLLSHAMLWDFSLCGQLYGLRDKYGEGVQLYRGLCHKDCPMCRHLYVSDKGLPRVVTFKTAEAGPLNHLDAPWGEVVVGGGAGLSFTAGSPHWWCETDLLALSA